MQLSTSVLKPPGEDSADGGTYSASFERDVSDVQLNLTRKTVTRNGVVIFGGKASGGGITVNDTFQDTGTMWHGQGTSRRSAQEPTPGLRLGDLVPLSQRMQTPARAPVRGPNCVHRERSRR